METKARQLRGGKNTIGLWNFIAKLPENIIMAEIGSYAGESTKMFLDSGKVKFIHCIDYWKNEEQQDAERIFKEVMKPYEGKFKVIRDYSANAEKHFTNHSLDGVYIDATHQYEFVKQDIQLWLPKIKPGGFISGHDFSYNFPGVIQAVWEAFGKPDFVFGDASWIVFLNK